MQKGHKTIYYVGCARFCEERRRATERQAHVRAMDAYLARLEAGGRGRGAGPSRWACVAAQLAVLGVLAIWVALVALAAWRGLHADPARPGA